MNKRPSKECFVIMPFAKSFDGIWESVIRPVVTDFGDQCIRADDISNVGNILEDLTNSIRSADYLIADLTSQNANVFYELGYAHALGKPVVLLTQSAGDVPFDLRPLRVIKYSDTASGAVQLRDALNQFISGV